MPLPEGYLPREGDELLIRAKVSHTVTPGETDVHLKIVGASYSSALLELSDVYALYCRSWEAGDKVQLTGDHDATGEVVAVADDSVWVRLNSGGYTTIAANDLEPQDVEPVKPPARVPIDKTDEIPF